MIEVKLDMNYPIIGVETKDKIKLYGLISESRKSNILYLNIHGTGSNFFSEVFQQVFYEELPKLGIDVLFTNNRGSETLDGYQNTGAALEIFEDSVLDIDAWIKWALDHNYTKIILSGHSFGTEKIVYYMNNGQYKNKISLLVLMGFCDTIGTQLNFEKTISNNLMAEAKEKQVKGKGYELLAGHQKANCGELPISADSYINYFSEGSKLSKVTPFRNNSDLSMIRSINIPILATVGDHEEYTIIPIKDAMSLLKKANPLVEVYQIKGSGHCYKGHQQELIQVIKNFISKID